MPASRHWYLVSSFAVEEKQMQLAQLKATQLGGTDLEITRVGFRARAIGGGWESALAGRAERPFVFTTVSLIAGP